MPIRGFPTAIRLGDGPFQLSSDEEIGAAKPHHFNNAAAALSVQITAEEVQSLEEAYPPHPTLGFS